MTRASMSRIPSLLTACVAVVGVSACTQVEKIDDGGSGAQIPDEVQRAFDDSCATAGCHSGGSPAQGLDLSAGASAAIIGGQATQASMPLVELGNVEGSYLAIKILEEMPPAGTRMPPTRPPGPDEAIIVGWIAGVSLPGGGDAGSDGSTTTADTGDGSGSSGSSMQLCGLADVAPAAANPFDIGTGAGQIPEDVGAVLTNNCGCHEVDATEVTGTVFAYTGMVHFSTATEAQSDYMGTPTYDVMLARVDNEANPMPPSYFCDVGDGSVITDADKQLLVDWLMAGAPDATMWP
ncbi:hypothetical protein [Paraliomyxa miuraensis]|uniref:hypothetical protein n=1 Tax=Paraliomyxa miuraensis TaxID=376150 RepID=UPI00224FF6B9|nr:hypothetical protein [Paraliomyxa miuraensis]MCX4242144.1 hypothetical protein [Paraliomyxa miuraensis]